MKTGYFEVRPGEKSMGRLIAFIGAVVGSVICTAGIVAAFVYPGNGVGIVAIGAGIFTSGAILKGWQKRTENGGGKHENTSMGVPS